MRKDTVLFLLGILVFLVPFVGVPEHLLDMGLFALGFLITTVAFACRVERRRRTRTKGASAHTEYNPIQEADVRSV